MGDEVDGGEFVFHANIYGVSGANLDSARKLISQSQQRYRRSKSAK